MDERLRVEKVVAAVQVVGDADEGVGAADEAASDEDDGVGDVDEGESDAEDGIDAADGGGGAVDGGVDASVEQVVAADEIRDPDLDSLPFSGMDDRLPVEKVIAAEEGVGDAEEGVGDVDEGVGDAEEGFGATGKGVGAADEGGGEAVEEVGDDDDLLSASFLATPADFVSDGPESSLDEPMEHGIENAAAEDLNPRGVAASSTSIAIVSFSMTSLSMSLSRLLFFRAFSKTAVSLFRDPLFGLPGFRSGEVVLADENDDDDNADVVVSIVVFVVVVLVVVVVTVLFVE